MFITVLTKFLLIEVIVELNTTGTRIPNMHLNGYNTGGQKQLPYLISKVAYVNLEV